MNDEVFWVVCRDNVECQFGGKYGSFFWKTFFACFILEYYFPFRSVAVFGAIYINVEVVRVFFLDVKEFLLMDFGMSVIFGEFG